MLNYTDEYTTETLLDLKENLDIKMECKKLIQLILEIIWLGAEYRIEEGNNKHIEYLDKKLIEFCKIIYSIYVVIKFLHSNT